MQLQPQKIEDVDVLVDERNGLMWLTEDLSSNAMVPNAADKKVAKFSAAGFSDWRVPTLPELETLRDLECFNPAADPALNLKSALYMTSTDVAAHRGEYVWGVSFCNGGSVYLYRHGDRAFVRLVRSVAPRQ
ncbi:MAG TPA: DUF1566 domain-containing protein [Burkholderiales bacterium]|nr:DUF1566 domain-containing protein [Burkholderiales bacterium]